MRLHGGRIMKRKVISPICILVCWYTENLLSGFLILLLLELPVSETRLVVTTPATISRDQLSVPPTPPGDFHHFTLFIIFPRVARQHWSLKSTALVVFRLAHEACLWFPGSYFVKSLPFPYSSLVCWNFNLLDFSKLSSYGVNVRFSRQRLEHSAVLTRRSTSTTRHLLHHNTTFSYYLQLPWYK
jgi:hypothetical protein